VWWVKMATWLTPFSRIWASLARRPPKSVSGAQPAMLSRANLQAATPRGPWTKVDVAVL